MRKTTAGLMSLALASGLGAALAAPSAAAPPDGNPVNEPTAAATSDSLPDPIAEKQAALREEAVASVIKGEATPERIGNSTVVKVGSGKQAQTDGSAAEEVDQYVELAREDTDQLFVLLVEFGNEREPRYPDQDTDPDIPGPSRFDGPLFNEIPEPNRAVDNSTDWYPNYDRAYYEDLYFGDGSVTGRESMRQYYERQSSGRYTVAGLVTEPVKVRYNEARYGRSDGFPCASNVCSNTWALVKDGLDQWYADQIAAGQTPEQIKATLAQYDVWDRVDFDADGNFDEPDGYIDHLQIVHAGGDQADGDPYQGEDAIWSHRWRAFQGFTYGPGPAGLWQVGGTPVGDTGIWAADYTIQPENGGLSVVAHEFGHDLGLPDWYDTSGPPPANENPVGWWSLMAQSRVSAPGDNAIGSRAADLDPWSKIYLGWFDYEVIGLGQKRTLELGPHEYNTDKPQGAVVVLPDKAVVTEFGAPYEGDNQYWSGSDDDLESTMARSVAVPAGTTTLSFQARWNIEDCGPDPCDYAYVEVDDGSGWVAVAGSITNADEGNGIDGLQEEWTAATFDLSAYAGKTVDVRVRYSTDGAVRGQDEDQLAGLFVDAIVITANGEVVFEDGAETGGEGWTFDGFSIVGASATEYFDNFYVASNREYVSFDQYLRTGPYNFGFPDRPDYAEHFPYQDGLLIWYWDTSQSDNNTSQHPGEGLFLPIDAHPETIYNLEGGPWRPRIQLYDAPFGLEKADSFTLHINGKPSYIRGQRGQPLFDDTDVNRYFKEDQPSAGVRVAGAGTKIRVLEENGTSVRVRFNNEATAPAAG